MHQKIEIKIVEKLLFCWNIIEYGSQIDLYYVHWAVKTTLHPADYPVPNTQYIVLREAVKNVLADFAR